MKKFYAVSALLIVLVGIFAYWFGSHSVIIEQGVYRDGSDSSQVMIIKSLRKECADQKKASAATIELLHMYYQDYDYEINSNDSVIERHRFFNHVIKKSEPYEFLDNFYEGDWEGFEGDDWNDSVTYYKHYIE